MGSSSDLPFLFLEIDSDASMSSSTSSTTPFEANIPFVLDCFYRLDLTSAGEQSPTSICWGSHVSPQRNPHSVSLFLGSDSSLVHEYRVSCFPPGHPSSSIDPKSTETLIRVCNKLNTSSSTTASAAAISSNSSVIALRFLSRSLIALDSWSTPDSPRFTCFRQGKIVYRLETAPTSTANPASSSSSNPFCTHTLALAASTLVASCPGLVAASGGNNNVIHLWNLREERLFTTIAGTVRPSKTLLVKHLQSGTSSSSSSSTTSLSTSSSLHINGIWNLGKSSSSSFSSDTTVRFTALTFDFEGRLLFAATNQGQLYAWLFSANGVPLATHVLIHNEEEDEEISHDGEEDVDGDDEGGHTLKFSCSWITCLQFHPIFSSSILLAGYSDGWIQVMHITKQTTSLSAQVIAKISNVVPGLSSRVKRLEWYPSVKKQQHDATEKDEDQQKEQQQHQETSTSSSPPRTHHQDVFLVVTDEEVSLFRVHSLNNISSTYMACIYRHFVHATRIIDAVWHPHVEEDCCAGMVASLSAKARGSSSRGGRNASLHGKSSE